MRTAQTTTGELVARPVMQGQLVARNGRSLSDVAYDVRQRVIELQGLETANILDAQLEGKSGADQARLLRRLLEDVKDPQLRSLFIDLEQL